MPRWTAAEAFGGREKRSQYGEVACFAGVRRVLPAHEQGVGGLGCGRVADDRPNLGRRCSGLLPSLPLRALAGRTGGIGSRPSVPHWWEGSNGYPRVLRPVAGSVCMEERLMLVSAPSNWVGLIGCEAELVLYLQLAVARRPGPCPETCHSLLQGILAAVDGCSLGQQE